MCQFGWRTRVRGTQRASLVAPGKLGPALCQLPCGKLLASQEQDKVDLFLI